MSNLFSQIAGEIVRAGLQQRTPILPDNNQAGMQQLLDQIYCVRETPKDFFKDKIIDFTQVTDQIIVPVSGGLDSSTLYFQAKLKFRYAVQAIYIDTNQVYRKKELKALKDLGIEFQVIKALDFSGYGEYWDHILPGRNFYYLCLLAEHINGGKILFGATAGEIPESGGDKSKRFFNLVNHLFTTLPYPVTVELPLAGKTKHDLVRWWKVIEDETLIHKTISCFSEEEGHCGRCRACLRKALSFLSNDLSLETNTPVLVGCKKYIEEYESSMTKELKSDTFVKYSKFRCQNDLEAIRRLKVLD